VGKRHFLIDPDDVPELGAHLVTRRSGYTHHGIYVGDARVIHYAGLSHGLHAGPIEEIDLKAFRGGQTTWVRHHDSPLFTPEDAILRARTRLHEEGYCFVANNCEHFVWWCIMGEHASPQVDRGVATSVTGIAVGGAMTARAAIAGAGVVNGLSGAGVMSGLKAASFGVGGAVGGLVNGPALAGTGAALLINSTVLRDRPGLADEERRARRVGRFASHAGSFLGVAGGVGAVSASGAVAGLAAR
jgi:hypothetical protein